MRFIRKEHIITTIFNKELTEEDEVKIVFNNIQKHGLEFSIVLKKFVPSNYDFINLNFDKVKIKKVYIEEKKIDILIFKDKIKTEMKRIPFEDVVEVKVITTKHKILDVDSTTTRFELLDLD